MLSSRHIRLLPDQVINQIAAGEVIERPAAAVKELLENSLDAGATQVEVEFSGGGKNYIRIEDNGCGMSPDQALLSLERHATSKLRNADDLLRLTTLGFRGEALPSVASISRFTLRTRARDFEHGTELLVDAGRLVHSRQCALPFGTRIEVAELFGPVPARRKFLKSDATEASHITQLVRLHALGRPDVGFHLIENRRTVFRSAPCPTMRDRVAEIWGGALARGLIELPAAAQKQPFALRLRGLVGRAGEGRTTRRDMIWLVNGRPIENRTLSNALIDAYEGFLPKGRFPLAFLFLEIDPAAVDVNIHPAKREVRFGSEGAVRHFVYSAVRELLSAQIHATFEGTFANGAQADAAGRACPDFSTNETPGIAEAAEPAAALLPPRPLPRPLPRPAIRPAAGSAGALPSSRPPQTAATPPAASRLIPAPKTENPPRSAAAPLADAATGGSARSSAPVAGDQPHPATATAGSSVPLPLSRAASALPLPPASAANRDSAQSACAEGNSIAEAEDSTTVTSAPSAAATDEAAAVPSAATSAPITTATIATADEDAPAWRFLARLHREYALLEAPAGLVVLRLRAAHERIWFERIRKYFSEEDRSSQQLLLPLSIEFDPLAAAALAEHLAFFNAHGFEVEAFGRNFFRIHAHPGWLAPERVESFVRECVEYARRGELRGKGQRAALEGIAKLAATRAVRLGDRLRPEEIEALAAALLRCREPLTCPSGKPTLIEWSLGELGRRFGLK